MRLQAVLFLLVTLGFCSASSQRTPPTTTTPSGAQVRAKSLFSQFIYLQTTPGPSQSNLGSNQDPNVCYTNNQEKGKCVKTSMCELNRAEQILTWYLKRTETKSANDCNFLMICCPDDKIKKQPVPPTIATPPGCGYSNQDLTGTSDSGYANFAEFPWMVALFKNPVNKQANGWINGDYLGGGTLIHPSVVLTVAHKVDALPPSDLKCRAGEWDTQNENEVYIHQDREVKKIILHEEFNRSYAHYDVALLIVNTPFLLQPHINVACLSSIMPPPGTLCYSMGWGMDFTMDIYNANVLKKIPQPLIRPDECERMFRKTRLGNKYLLHHTLTCAGGLPNIVMGDGGSSLVCPVRDPAEPRYTVVGLLVYSLNCGLECPDIYVKVPELYNWVNQQMNMEGFSE